MTVKTEKKRNSIIILLIIFLTGFLCGIGFSVWKLDEKNPSVPSLATPPQTTLQQRITTLQQTVKTHPDDGSAWMQLGNLYYDTNQPEKAITAYLRSLELQPGSADLLTDLGVMYRRTQQWEQAILSFEKAVLADPQHIPSRFNKGVVLLNDLQRPVEAITAWDEIIKIDPNATTASGQRIADIIAGVRKNITQQGKSQ